MKEGFAELMQRQAHFTGSPRDINLIREELTRILSDGSPAHCFVVFEKEEVVAVCISNLWASIESGGKKGNLDGQTIGLRLG